MNDYEKKQYKKNTTEIIIKTIQITLDNETKVILRSNIIETIIKEIKI